MRRKCRKSLHSNSSSERNTPSGTVMPLRWASRRMSDGGAVPSRWTCSSTLGSAVSGGGTFTRSAPGDHRPLRRRLVADRDRLVERPHGLVRGRLVGGVDDRQRAIGPDLGADGRDLGQPDRGVDDVVLAAAVAAEAGDHEADGPAVHALDDAGALGRGRAGDGRGGESAGVLEQVGRPAERGDHGGEALGGGAGVERLLGGRAAVLGEPALLDQRAGERDRHLVQPRLARRAGEVVDRLAHLDGVAGRGAEHLVHVGQQRDRGQSGAAGHLDQRARQLFGVLAPGQERAGAELDVHHQRVEPGGELLGEDGGDDQRHRLDGAGGVADRVQAPVGGRHLGGLADDRAADLVDHALEPLDVGPRVVAGDRVELVERAAGVAEAAAGDHRHRAAAGGDDRRQHQRHLVADPAGRVLVEHRPAEVPLQHLARVRHRGGQRDALVGAPSRAGTSPSPARRPGRPTASRR